MICVDDQVALRKEHYGFKDVLFLEPKSILSSESVLMVSVSLSADRWLSLNGVGGYIGLVDTSWRYSKANYWCS